MPMFVAIHKWKPEESISAMKETINYSTLLAAGKVPEGVECTATYSNVAGNGAFCVWTAPTKEVLEKLFEKYAPVIKKGTEFVPVVQMIPPTLECEMAMAQQMIQAASMKK